MTHNQPLNLTKESKFRWHCLTSNRVLGPILTQAFTLNSKYPVWSSPRKQFSFVKCNIVFLEIYQKLYIVFLLMQYVCTKIQFPPYLKNRMCLSCTWEVYSKINTHLSSWEFIQTNKVKRVAFYFNHDILSVSSSAATWCSWTQTAISLTPQVPSGQIYH